METELNIYEIVAPLQRKYGEDIVQGALLDAWENRPEIYQKPPVEFLKFITAVCRDDRKNEKRDEANRKHLTYVYFRPNKAVLPVDIEAREHFENYEQEIDVIEMLPVSESTKSRKRQALRERYRTLLDA